MARIKPELVGGGNVTAFLDMLAVSEGTAHIGDEGYNVIVGSTLKTPHLFTDYDRHPGVLASLKDKAGRVVLHSTAAGRYQFLLRTWTSLCQQHAYRDFRPETQDLACVQMIKDARALELIRSGDLKKAIAQLCHLWASLPGAGYKGQKEQEMGTLVKAYASAGGRLDVSTGDVA